MAIKVRPSCAADMSDVSPSCVKALKGGQHERVMRRAASALCRRPRATHNVHRVDERAVVEKQRDTADVLHVRREHERCLAVLT
jgi:hypothetical protein